MGGARAGSPQSALQGGSGMDRMGTWTGPLARLVAKRKPEDPGSLPEENLASGTLDSGRVQDWLRVLFSCSGGWGFPGKAGG